MRAIARPVLGLVLAFAVHAPSAIACEQVQAIDAWIALSPPTARVSAGYLKLENHGAATRLVAISVEGFARAEVHETVRDGGRMSMRPRPALDLAAGATLEFAPGGLHLMLFDPATPLRAGATHAVTFRFADGRTLTARAEVRDP